MATLTPASTSSTSRNVDVSMSKCIVCSLRFRVPLEFQTHRHSQKHLARVFERIFNVFCNYLNLQRLLAKSGNRYRWNFDEETLPFCAECKQTVAKLVLLHDQLEGIQSKINKVVADISLTIMESQNENNNIRNNSNSNSSQDEDVPDDKENNCVKDSEYNFRKVTRMRKAVRRFLNPAVILNDISSAASPSSSEAPSTIVDSDDNDAMNSLITRPLPRGNKNNRQMDNNNKPPIVNLNSNSNSGVNNNSIVVSASANTSTLTSSQQNTIMNTNKKEEPDNEKISDLQINQSIESGNIVRNPLAINFKSGSDDKEKPQAAVANQDRPSIICKTVSNLPSSSSSAVGSNSNSNSSSSAIATVNEQQPMVLDNQSKNVVKEQVQSDLNDAGEKKEKEEDKKEEEKEVTIEETVKERRRFFYINTWPIEKLTGGKYMCMSCEVNKDDRNGIAEHVKSEHPGRKKYQYKCQMKDCDRDFVVLRSFLYHLEIVHCDVYPEGELPLIISCGPGRFLYDFQWFYVATEDEKFQCQKCGFVAADEKTGETETIIKHIFMHKAMDTTECDICGKIFKRKEGLRMHKALMHTEEQPSTTTLFASSSTSLPTSKKALPPPPPLQSSTIANTSSTNVNASTTKTTTPAPPPLRIKSIKLPPSATKATTSKTSPSSSSCAAIVPAPKLKLVTAIKSKPGPGPASSKASTSSASASATSTSTPTVTLTSTSSSSSPPPNSAPVKSSSDHGNVKKLAPNKFLYLDKFAFELLPNGAYKCSTCSIIKKGFQINMVKHIKTHAFPTAKVSAAFTTTSTVSTISATSASTSVPAVEKTPDKEKKSMEGPAAKKKKIM